jgi:hypothetical protein
MKLSKRRRFVAKKLQSTGNFGANITYPYIVFKPLGTFNLKQKLTESKPQII